MIGAFGADHSPGLQQSVLACYELSAARHKRLMAALKTSHKSVGLYWRAPPDLPPLLKTSHEYEASQPDSQHNAQCHNIGFYEK